MKWVQVGDGLSSFETERKTHVYFDVGLYADDAGFHNETQYSELDEALSELQTLLDDGAEKKVSEAAIRLIGMNVRDLVLKSSSKYIGVLGHQEYLAHNGSKIRVYARRELLI